MTVVCSSICTEVLDLPSLITRVEHDASGAIVSFEGIVRDHDSGRSVTGIDYTSHPLAADILRKIAEEIDALPGVRALGVIHRIGYLAVGERALVLAVSAEHRGQAFHACSLMIDMIKEQVPIWKKQHFHGGRAEWSNLPDSLSC